MFSSVHVDTVYQLKDIGELIYSDALDITSIQIKYLHNFFLVMYS